MSHVCKAYATIGKYFKFMNDNVSCYCTLCVDDLESEGIYQMEWSVHSPNLNPLKHIWDVTESRMAEHNLSLWSKKVKKVYALWIYEESNRGSRTNIKSL